MYNCKIKFKLKTQQLKCNAFVNIKKRITIQYKLECFMAYINLIWILLVPYCKSMFNMKDIYEFVTILYIDSKYYTTADIKSPLQFQIYILFFCNSCIKNSFKLQMS